MALRFVAFLGLALAVFACGEPTEPAELVAPSQFVSVTAGRLHACAVDTIGRAWCWGDGSHGQVASASQACLGCTVLPAPIESELRFAALSAGQYHTCGITAAGAAYCWGDNGLGQLGAGAVGYCSGSFTCSTTPLPVVGGHQFKSITAGSYGTCAITVNDVLKCWGYQMFAGVLSNSSPTTVRFAATGDSLWSHVGHTDGGLNGCGITINGITACWGQSLYGQLGTGAVTSSRSNPVAINLNAVVRSVSNGTGFSCALSSIGDAYCWGLSYHGGLGVGGDAVATACSAVAPDACFPTPLKVVGARQYSRLAVGSDHVCGLDILTSEAWCWGSNSQAAIGTPLLGMSGVAPSPFASGDGTKFSSLSAGWLFTCGVMPDKNIACWGNNNYGQLGYPRAAFAYTALPLRILVRAE